MAHRSGHRDTEKSWPQRLRGMLQRHRDLPCVRTGGRPQRGRLRGRSASSVPSGRFSAALCKILSGSMAGPRRLCARSSVGSAARVTPSRYGKPTLPTSADPAPAASRSRAECLPQDTRLGARRSPAADLLARDGALRILGDEPVVVGDADRIEKCRHHRPLVRQVVAHQHARRQQIGHAGKCARCLARLSIGSPWM